MLLINLNTSTLETFLQEHPDAIFSVSPFFLKLFFYSKKYKRIFALKSSYLTHARKLYKKVQTIIKRQKKTIKDILKLDECYNFHKEIS